MISIVLNGAAGKMGCEFAQAVKKSECAKIVAGIDIKKFDSFQQFDFSVSEDFPEIEADVVVDFSNPAALNKILNFAERTKTAVVLATTGYDYDQVERIKKASKTIPIFFSFNMSIGINLLIYLVKKAYSVLGGRFDVEIIEKHHNQKIDAPSGTAIMIAEALNEQAGGKFEYVYDRHGVRQKRSKNEIGLHSIRGGTIVGEHEVIFAGRDEMIDIKHMASSKRIFAEGALNAAFFVHDKPAGLYDMDDLIKGSICGSKPVC